MIRPNGSELSGCVVSATKLNDGDDDKIFGFTLNRSELAPKSQGRNDPE